MCMSVQSDDYNTRLVINRFYYVKEVRIFVVLVISDTAMYNELKISSRPETLLPIRRSFLKVAAKATT
jgi:hypothetical protein